MITALLAAEGVAKLGAAVGAGLAAIWMLWLASRK